MACNCATEKELSELYRRFGYKVKGDGKTAFSLYVKRLLTYIGVVLVMLFTLPILLGYILYKAVFGDGRISLTDFFGFKGEYVNVREQQDIQDQD